MSDHDTDSERIDADAVNRARNGDAAAYDELVLRYRQIVYALAYHVLQEAHTAEDVCQESLIRAYLELDSLNDPSRFAPWLKRITLRVCSETARKRASRRRVEDRVADSSRIVDPFLDALEDEADKQTRWAAQVQEAVEQLSQDQCDLLALYYLRGLTHEQIANFIQAPKGTVKRRLFDARRKLQATVSVPEYRSADPGAAAAYLRSFRAALQARTTANG